MIRYTQGNLLDSGAEALVNTVNTVGVMGKGIALMFRERFDHNYRLYVQACKAGQVRPGRMFVTETGELSRPRWIVNFPTKQDWRSPSRIEWVEKGLADLRLWLQASGARSIAIPPLGAGNGGLDWALVKPRIADALADLTDVDVQVYEPTATYQNVAKRKGVEALTPARALVAELVRRYWVLGMECSLLEIQKLAWFLERSIERLHPGDRVLDLRFSAHYYGPYAPRLAKLLEALDGSYLHCDKRIQDADKLDVIWFDDSRKAMVQAFLASAARPYLPALEATAELIEGFESPFGLELLATVDWLLARQHVKPELAAVREGLHQWPVASAARRKARLFDDRALAVAIERLTTTSALQPVA